jgi:creatinine amidohydrolase
VIRDVLDNLAGSGFRRILIVNGHGGNISAQSYLTEWMADNPGVQVKYHCWWNAPRTQATQDAIDPIASHASWMENYPWTRLADVVLPQEQKPLFDAGRSRMLGPQAFREQLGDGNFGGYYQRPDEEMMAIWKVGVEETRVQLTDGWA